MAAAFEERSSLDPIVRAAREEHFCNSILVCDLTKSPRWCDHFKKYGLTDFFDSHGQRKFHNLSMSFVAKQQLIEKEFASCGQDTGTKSLKKKTHFQTLCSARANRLATATVQHDKEIVQQRMKEQFA